MSGSPCVLLPPLQRWLGGSWCHHACHLPSVLPGGGTCPARGSTGLGPAGSSSRDARGQGQPCSAPRLSTQSQRQHRGEVLVTPPGTPRHMGSGLYWDFRHLQALLHSGRGGPAGARVPSAPQKCPQHPAAVAVGPGFRGLLWERSGGVGLRPGEGDANHPARPKPGSCPAQHGARHPPSLLHPPMPLLAAPGPVSPPTAACQAPSCPHRATEPPFHVGILLMLEPGTSSAIPELRLPPCPPPPGPGHPTARSAPTSPCSCCRCSWPALRVLLLLPISSSIFLISILAATSLVLLSVACLELPQPGEAPGWVRDTGAGGWEERCPHRVARTRGLGGRPGALWRSDSAALVQVPASPPAAHHLLLSLRRLREGEGHGVPEVPRTTAPLPKPRTLRVTVRCTTTVLLPCAPHPLLSPLSPSPWGRAARIPWPGEAEPCPDVHTHTCCTPRGAAWAGTCWSLLPSAHVAPGPAVGLAPGPCLAL